MLSIWQQGLGPEHAGVVTSRDNLAALYAAQGQYGEAEPLYLRALALREQMLGPDHPEIAARLSSLAEFYRVQGRYDRAEPLYLRAIATWQKTREPPTRLWRRASAT